MKRVAGATAAFVAAVAVFTLAGLPARHLALTDAWDDGTVAGILHVHGANSDGSGTFDDIAAAAGRAGLRFVIFTEHGDGTRAPEPPTYRGGVLCIDAAEISTNDGHVIALDLPQTPYPLAGEARDVVDDIHRLGGFAIAAHPDSPKRELRWRDWDVKVDAVEILNPDTGWRTELTENGAAGKLAFARALLTYPWRGRETLAALLTNSTTAVERWSELTSARRVVGIAGADAHAKISLRDAAPGDNRLSWAIPGYDTSFRVLSVHVQPAQALSGNANDDAAQVLAAIRGGRLYAAVDGWAGPAAFEFSAANTAGTAGSGLELSPGGAVTLRVKSNAPAGYTATIWRGSEVLAADRPEREFTIESPAAVGAFRAELRRPGAANRPAWIYSNPIYIRAAQAATPEVIAPPALVRQFPLFDGKTMIGWSPEHDPSSLAAVEPVTLADGPWVRVRYALSGGSRAGQFGGAAADTAAGLAEYDRVVFTARAEHPLRLSIQARASFDDRPTERWQRSVYVDTQEREIVVRFDDMRPIGQPASPAIPLAAVHSVMFIVDTTNSAPGASGRFWLKNSRLEK